MQLSGKFFVPAQLGSSTKEESSYQPVPVELQTLGLRPLAGNKTIGDTVVSVLAHQGCYNKLPQAGWLEKQTFIFS